MLTNSFKISVTNKADFIGLKVFKSDEKYDKITAVNISAVFRSF